MESGFINININIAEYVEVIGFLILYFNIDIVFLSLHFTIALYNM